MSFQPLDSGLSASAPDAEDSAVKVAKNPSQTLPTTAAPAPTGAMSGADLGAALATGTLAAAEINPSFAGAAKTVNAANTALDLGAAAANFAAPSPTPFNGDAASTDTPAVVDAPPAVIAEHPLAGRAVSDFATKDLPFLPTPATAKAADDAPSAAAQIAYAAIQGKPILDDDNRMLRFYAPLPISKRLLVDTLQGEASISGANGYRLTLISQNPSIDLKDVLGKNVTVGIQQTKGGEAFMNGYVSSFGFLSADGGLAYYHADVVPWLDFLTRRVNSRIFQDKDVKQVLEEIFAGDYGGIADFEFRLGGEYPKESYLVQYSESDANFVCRLMEKYGLFHYYEHRKDGHKLVITDDSCNASFCPPHERHAQVEFNSGNRTSTEESVTHLTAQRMMQPTKVALNTFDFKAPHAPQYVEEPTIAQQGEVPPLEIYDGNPAFSYRNLSDGQREARQRMQVLEWQAKTFDGGSDCRSLIAGHTFILKDHHWFDQSDSEDAHFLVLAVNYQARNNFFEQGGDSYRNSFMCIRRKIPYRPPMVHQKPRMPGPQTATVVGPKGMEIHTDSYGRIKVQFHWDRYGRNDERSSCWIRVSQPWAGKGWGTVAIPRIAQEVIIDYLEGDPDRPICTGRLFNADQPAPYALPDGAHMMGFKSRSTPGGGGFSEMVIHDKKGKELINIHSQKDMATTVQHTQATLVNGPYQTNTVANGFQVTTVKKKIEMESQTEHILLKANTSITLEVGASKIHMDANGVIRLEGVHIDAVGSSRIDLNKKA